MPESAPVVVPSVLVETKVKKEGFYWHSLKHVPEVTTWDVLAKTDSVHAAISAGDEKSEQSKGEAGIELLKTHLREGVTLDVGCGYGRIAKYLLPQRVLQGYVGLDSSVVMLTHFQNRYSQQADEQRTPLTLVQSDIDDLPLHDGSVSNAIVSAVFLHNHKRTTRKSIGEIARVLVPGGKLFVISSFPNGVSLTGVLGYAYNIFLALTGNAYKNGPVRYFSAREVRSLLSSFAHVEVTRMGFEVLPKTVIIFPGFINRWYRESVSRPLNVWLSERCPAKLKPFFCTHYDVIATK